MKKEVISRNIKTILDILVLCKFIKNNDLFKYIVYVDRYLGRHFSQWR